MSLKIEGLTKKYNTGNKELLTLNNINLTVEDGEFVCILGPSGCGKSTLLNIIAGFEKPTVGKAFINGREITEPGSDRAVVFQNHALFPWLKVIENVEFGMKIAGIGKEERTKKALHYLEMMHLTNFKDSFVHELSGGMMQRVSIARALSLDSKILLMDEPFSSLDSQTRELLEYEIQKIWWNTKKTVIFITHNVEEAVLLADRVIVMSVDPATIKKEFKIQLARPREIHSNDVAYIVRKIMDELREEVEKVAKAEYDDNWNTKKDVFLYDGTNNMGTGI